MAAQPAQHGPGWWEPVWELVVHVLVGSALFAIIFLPAIGLDLAIRWMEEAWKVSEFLSGLLTGTKYAVAVIDAFLYLAFMVRMGYLFLKKLYWGDPRHD